MLPCDDTPGAIHLSCKSKGAQDYECRCEENFVWNSMLKICEVAEKGSKCLSVPK